MRITFLGYSSFLVDTGGHLLLFDYAPRRLRRESDPLLRRLLAGRHCTVFVSHAHPDHFDPAIYDLPDCSYVVSEDTPAQRGAQIAAPDTMFVFDGLSIRTFRSTDLGVAYLLRADGKILYHAGDLNWWHWDEASEEENAAMKQAFLAQAEKLVRAPIDLAFLTADPRQKDAWLWGFDHLLREGRIAHAVPMHFWNIKSTPQRVHDAACCAPYRERIVTGLVQCGDTIVLP